MSDTNQPGSPDGAVPEPQPVEPNPSEAQPGPAAPVVPEPAAAPGRPVPSAPDEQDPIRQWAAPTVSDQAAPAPPAPPVVDPAQQWAPPVAQTPAIPGPAMQVPAAQVPPMQGGDPAQQWVPQPGAPGAPGGPGVPGAPYPAHGAPPVKRGLPKWALWLIIGGSAAILAIIALVVVLVVVISSGGPKGTASDYLSSLSSGKVAAANKIARVDGDKRLAVLESDAYAKSKHATDYELTSISQSNDRALASATYKVDGSTVRGTFELRKDDKGWYVSRGLTDRLPRVYGSNGADAYRLPGYDGLITNDLSLEAYPGVYTAEPPNKYFEFSKPFVFEIGSEGVSGVDTPKLVPSQAMADEIDAQLKTHIDECLKSVTDLSSVRKCGISGYPSKVYDVKKATVSVKSYPKVELQQYSYELKEKGAATATFTGKTSGGGEGSETLDVDFSRLIFRPVFEDGKLSITYY